MTDPMRSKAKVEGREARSMNTWGSSEHKILLCRRIQVRPFPRPIGNDGALPLMSSTADIFHIVNAHRGTIIRDNFFVNSGAALRTASSHLPGSLLLMTCF